jgi:hypothetical protein
MILRFQTSRSIAASLQPRDTHANCNSFLPGKTAASLRNASSVSISNNKHGCRGLDDVRAGTVRSLAQPSSAQLSLFAFSFAVKLLLHNNSLRAQYSQFNGPCRGVT